MSKMEGKSEAYKEAGVDIDLATQLLKNVKGRISATRTPQVLAPIGGFGGLYRIDLTKWKKPVMVVSVDGVGTKLMIAAMMQKFDTVGHDIVNHCINDIAVQGATPVYFLDYIGIGKMRSPLYEDVLGGCADACKAEGVCLIGGESAEMPGMYGNDFDLVGCITGIVEEDRIITGEKIRPGDVALGISSKGLQTNGFSLARKVLFDKGGFNVNDRPAELGGRSVGEALLEPHECFWKAVKSAIDSDFPVNGIAHITGGGLYDNVPRVLPDARESALTRVESKTSPRSSASLKRPAASTRTRCTASSTWASAWYGLFLRTGQTKGFRSSVARDSTAWPSAKSPPATARSKSPCSGAFRRDSIPTSPNDDSRGNRSAHTGVPAAWRHRSRAFQSQPAGPGPQARGETLSGRASRGHAIGGGASCRIRSLHTGARVKGTG